MGDFNDYPTNESLDEVLSEENLFNLMQTDIPSGLGSYNYKGKWNWLDQFILSNNFLNDSVKILSAGSFEDTFIFYKNSKGDLYPSRTYGGNNWYGGFSDHLPIYCKFGFITK